MNNEFDETYLELKYKVITDAAGNKRFYENNELRRVLYASGVEMWIAKGEDIDSATLLMGKQVKK